MVIKFLRDARRYSSDGYRRGRGVCARHPSLEGDDNHHIHRHTEGMFVTTDSDDHHNKKSTHTNHTPLMSYSNDRSDTQMRRLAMLPDH